MESLNIQFQEGCVPGSAPDFTRVITKIRAPQGRLEGYLPKRGNTEPDRHTWIMNDVAHLLGQLLGRTARPQQYMRVEKIIHLREPSNKDRTFLAPMVSKSAGTSSWPRS